MKKLEKNGRIGINFGKIEELEEKILKSGWIGIKMRRIRKIGKDIWRNWKKILEKLEE